MNRAELERLKEAIDAAISTTRVLISELRRPVFEHSDLAAALVEPVASRSSAVGSAGG